MKKKEDIAVIIQARTTSTRVPNKMLKPFAGSSLFEIAVKKVLRSREIPNTHFYVSVLDKELFEIANRLGVNTYERSEESTKEPVTLQKVFDWHNKLYRPYKHYILINACNPLLKVKTIDKFYESFRKTDSNGMFGVFEKRTFLFDSEYKMMNKFNGPDKYLATLETKFVEPTFEAAHSLYAGTLSDIKKDIYMGTFKEKGNPDFFPMEEIECFDIDWPWQFDVAEKLYEGKYS